MVIHGEGRERSAACNSPTQGGGGGVEGRGPFTGDKKTREEGDGKRRREGRKKETARVQSTSKGRSKTYLINSSTYEG